MKIFLWFLHIANVSKDIQIVTVEEILLNPICLIILINETKLTALELANYRVFTQIGK